jgi:hypothetical protein
MQDWHFFIRMTLAFAFGTGEELGIDPHIKFRERPSPLTSNMQKGWSYMVGGQEYYILKIINDHRARSSFGRGTRILEAERVHDKRRVVIKDMWRDLRQRDEVRIQKEILAAFEEKYAEKVLEEDIYALAKGALFEHDESSGDVKLLIDPSGTPFLDSTQAMISRNGKSLPLNPSFPRRPLQRLTGGLNTRTSFNRSNKRTLEDEANPTVVFPSLGRAKPVDEEELPLSGPHYRQHHILIMHQAATSLHDVKDLATRLRVLHELSQCN